DGGQGAGGRVGGRRSNVECRLATRNEKLETPTLNLNIELETVPSMAKVDEPSPTVWREGDLVVARRDQPLPPICVLSGRPASRRVPCLFHWRDRLPGAGGVEGLALHYVQDVWKVPLAIP